MVEAQATDRAFRIGQERNVLVHKSLRRRTVEGKIDALIDTKRQLSHDLLDGGAGVLLTEMSGEALLELAALNLLDASQDRPMAYGYARRSRYARDDWYGGWKPYVPVAARRRQATHELAKLRKNGHATAPVHIDGRKIATTFWGTAWCKNLERYSDFANRLPRGRTYVRNGSVIDLQVARGAVTALVSGSAIYTVRIGVTAVAKARWQGICRDCTGAIDSLVELLQGTLSTRVMSRICEPKTGLFPEPAQLSFDCSCPDWASMCKHVAAALYGVGARFDERPELLFLLRGVDQQDLIAEAGAGLRPSAKGRAADTGKVLESSDLSEMFGIEVVEPEPARRAPVGRKTRGRTTAVPAAKSKPVASAPAAKSKPVARTAQSKRVTRAPAAGAKTTPAARPAPKATARRTMTARDRAAVSARMKKYWAARRKATRQKPR